MDIRKRLKDTLFYYNATLNSISLDSAMQTRLSRQVNGGATITYDTILRFLQIFPDISAEWLVRGEGSMFLSDHEIPLTDIEPPLRVDYEKMIEKTKTEVDELKQMVNELKDKIKEQKGCIEWQKEFISDLVVENHELEKYNPNPKRKKDIV